uniref:Acyl-coenzyme A oxidase n=1 Tax=Cardiosporidium cionae TaxID=476202 RepID=A0A3Q8UBC4_9APIC|nr:acyl-CoA oxidase [Cardiosporidium cionae]
MTSEKASSPSLLRGAQFSGENCMANHSSDIAASDVGELARERKNSALSVPKITNIIYGQDLREKMHYVYQLVVSHSLFKDSNNYWWIDNKQRYLQACATAEEFVKLIRLYKLHLDDDYLSVLQLLAGEDFFILLHLTMFLPAMKSLADPEQLKEWLPLAEDFRILGTYAQTEIAHGSNVGGLQTTADLDCRTDEWILNTPNLHAIKWWPGGLAKSCTHCVLMARLRIRGKDYGVHPFFLQVRNLENHESLKGIYLFHIGQKLGYNGMDNGGMQLQNVRIPRTHLLMRFYHVDKAGNYKTVGNTKLLYSTMTYTRKQIIWAAGCQLARGIVIAIRYSAVRRQFPSAIDTSSSTSMPSESQVLDYLSQQFMLFPLLSTAIAFCICGRWVHGAYKKLMEESKVGVLERLTEMHCLTSSLKATMSMIVIDGLETCRKCCGGHGFQLAAGIPLILASYLPQATYEGDFVILSIQAGRLLLRTVEKKMKNKFLPYPEENSMQYIYEFDPFDETSEIPEGDAWLSDKSWLLKIFKRRANVLIYKAAQLFSSTLAEDSNMLTALDYVKIELTKITKAHAHVLVLTQFQNQCQLLKEDSTTSTIFNALCDLYALYWIYEAFGEFVFTRALSADHYETVLHRIKELLKIIRPHAIPLADAFSLPDYLLNSALGRYDGNVYEALFNSVRNEPLNECDITEGYYRNIQFILHPERKQLSIAKL